MSTNLKTFVPLIGLISVLTVNTKAQYTVTSILYNPYPFNIGTSGLMGGDDQWSSIVNIPFNFYFFGTNYNQLVIGGNGCVSFDIANANNFCAWSFSASCPDPGIISGSIGPYILGPYHDLDPSIGGNIYYTTIGQYPFRRFIISWYNVPMFNATCNSLLATQQIVLYETYNCIDIYIHNAPLCPTWNSGNKVIGIQNAQGTVGISPPGRNTGTWGTIYEAWRFSLGECAESGGFGIISGNIFHDINFNCNFDSVDYSLSNWLVKVEPGPSYALSNINGFYSAVAFDTGTFTVTQIPPNNLWGLNCPSSPDYYTVTFTEYYDTSYNNDFAIKADILCAFLQVDISTWAIRPCMNSIYTVSYCNNGTIPALNVYIEVEFDTIITPLTSTLPWTSQSGNVYTFDIGTLQIFECGSFQITADVSCDAVVGSTHCVEAKIYPDTLCFPSPAEWDHSSVAVEGVCVGDSSACFTIYNTGEPGNGDMDTPSQYRIYENNVLVYTGQFQLAGGNSLVICWQANGNTIRLEADQNPGHPGNSHPQESVEGCGGFIALGQILVVPEDDIDYNVEIDCREVTASYDPNEKLVKPIGLTDQHYIDSTDVLEYQINFQNTGNDTAFKVVILDTLSQYLDITTIEKGASSHPYTFEIYGQGILKWTFDNILLPDSTTNEPLSHGFVKFKVHQKPGNTQGTLIENRAGIIFDYNAPVLTETVWNIVYNDFILGYNKPIIYDNLIEVKVYPNPTNGDLRFTIYDLRFKNIELKIYDMLGNEVFKSEIQKPKSEINPKLRIRKIGRVTRKE